MTIRYRQKDLIELRDSFMVDCEARPLYDLLWNLTYSWQFHRDAEMVTRAIDKHALRVLNHANPGEILPEDKRGGKGD